MVTLQGNTILQGFRSPATRGLWMMELPAQHLTNNAINFSASASQLVTFAHAALCSPALSMLQRALDKSFLPPFPGLTAQTLRKQGTHDGLIGSRHVWSVYTKWVSCLPAIWLAIDALQVER